MLIKWIIQFLLYVVAVFIAARVLPGVQIKNIKTAAWVAILLGIANNTIYYVLKVIVFIPNLFTLFLLNFLFNIIISAIIIKIVDAVVEDFKVNGFLWAIVFSIVLSLVNSVLGWVIF